MTFEPKLIKLSITEAAELRRQASKHSNQTELSRNGIDDETKPCPLRKLEAFLGFAVCVDERVSRRQQIGVQTEATISRKGEVADPVCRIKGAMDQISSGSNMLRPRNNKISEREIGAGLETSQATLLDQVIAELAKTDPDSIAAKALAGYHAKVNKGEARSVAVAMLKT
jgi:hypothetical protein